MRLSAIDRFSLERGGKALNKDNDGWLRLNEGLRLALVRVFG